MDQGEEVERGEEGGRHSRNISKLDLAGENSRYLITDLILLMQKVKQVVCISVCLDDCACDFN